jgi:hypothetical protein
MLDIDTNLSLAIGLFKQCSLTLLIVLVSLRDPHGSIEFQHVVALISEFNSLQKTPCCEGNEWAIKVKVQ